ncbi:unnamed protein product [marine sediment metagenome]|uniref:Uncharacterized protein n=1 Tax=marine sediment metagenome TaxID=412755 RepID=X0SZB5_9ZZZZ
MGQGKKDALIRNGVEMILDSHEEIIRILLPEIIKLAEQHDGLVEPDETTERIMMRAIGCGFTIGVAYGDTNKDDTPRERLSQAFAIIRARQMPFFGKGE